MTEVTCNKCGRVAFGVTRGYAEAAIAEFAAYFRSLPVQQQQDCYGGRLSTLADYDRCTLCRNPWTNFRPSVDGDCPRGCTLSPIISELPGARA